MVGDLEVTLGRHGAVEVHGQHDEEDWKITLAETGEETQTGGRLVAVRKYLGGDEPFLLTYGDGVSDVDVGATIAAHRAHGKVASVTAVRAPGRFGEMVVDAGRVRQFQEKPLLSAGFISGGFFVLDSRRIWDYVAPSPGTIFEQEPLRALAGADQLMAYAHQGFWQPMDTYREYQLLNGLWASGQAPWKTW